MYQLTLSKDERRAIDWVGHRYGNGSSLRAILTRSGWTPEELDGEEITWDSACDLTFSVPEHLAWQIQELAEEDDFSWPCFAPALAHHLQDFVDSIV